MTDQRTALRLVDVRKSFGGVVALKGVSLDVNSGEVHALLGENGAGKSTLISIAAGSLVPDAGSVEIGGTALGASTPGAARALGVGVVYQHPALAEDLTVAENLLLGVPRDRRPKFNDAGRWARERLAVVGVEIDPSIRTGELTSAKQQLVEIAKALALEPRVLILDEPTAALSSKEVDYLFEQVRRIRAAGTAVVYISHRIPEVSQISDRITVLRDGEHRGTFETDKVTEDDILDLIVGRELDAVFPSKSAAESPQGDDDGPLLRLRGLSGEAFHNVDLEVHRGEIVGLAGVVGNGQREIMRALAGLEAFEGEMAIAGEPSEIPNPRRARAAGIHYVPGDRQREGLFGSLTVRENAAANSLRDFASSGLVRRGVEDERVSRELEALAVKTDSAEAGVLTLSGGNQQKVVFARNLIGNARILLCDEPTQGVDVGARVELYRLLRDLADAGTAVLVCSSDSLELEGLCDRVLICSRGSIVAELEGDEVSESRITAAALTATSERRPDSAERGEESRKSRLGRFLRGDSVAVPVLLAVIAAFAVYTGVQNPDFLSSFNLQNLLLLSTALMLAAIGQLAVLLTAGVDLSVGPAMGLGLVVLTSFATDEGGTGGLVIGLGVLLVTGVLIGLVNGSLVRFARISPVIATLATFIAIQGVALLINPVPDGLLAASVFETLAQGIADTVPYVFLVVLAIGIGMEFMLRRSSFGLSLRAVGSDDVAAHRIGVRTGRTLVLAYVICSVFAVLASVMLAVQIGTGDAQAGTNYTLTSIAAVVLGGASIYGGRGSFLGAVLGGLLLTEVIGALSFLQLGEAWQFWLPGGIVLVSAFIYARAIGFRVTPAEET